MAKHDCGMAVTIALVAGLAGGMASSLLLWGKSARAQSSDQGAVRDTVTARAFVLVDGSGKERGSIRVGDDGVSRLTLCDPAGKRRATLGVTSKGTSALLLYDAADESRAVLMSRSDGVPELVLYDAAGGMRVALESAKDGAPSLTMRDAGGKAIWSAP